MTWSEVITWTLQAFIGAALTAIFTRLGSVHNAVDNNTNKISIAQQQTNHRLQTTNQTLQSVSETLANGKNGH